MLSKSNKLDKKTQESLLYGSKDEKIEIIYNDGTRVFKSKKVFEGIIPNLTRRLKESESKWVKEELGRFQSDKDCEKCNGKRLKTTKNKILRDIKSEMLKIINHE